MLSRQPAIATPIIEISQAGQVLEYAPGTVTAWGNNSSGKATVPAGLTGVRSVSAGVDHCVALLYDGTVVCWGSNSSKQTTVPDGLAGIKAISCGAYHTLALREDGTVVAWGSNDYNQQTVPPGLDGVSAVAAGGLFSMALRSDGTVVAWGNNSNGQRNVPAGLAGVKAIAAGDAHGVAVKADGTVAVWGNAGGTIPANLSGVVAVAGGGRNSLALKSDGTLAFWGSNTLPAGITGVQSIALGSGLSMALLSNGTVRTWGNAVLTPPAGLIAASGICAGYNHALAINGAVPSVDLGFSPVGTIGPAKTLTLKNTGDTTLNIPRISAAGPGAAELILTLPALPATLAAGEELTFSVQLRAAAKGIRYGAVLIHSDDPAGSERRINFTGTAPETNASLASLTVSGGTLDPAFASGTTDYAVTLPRGQATATFTATAAAPPVTIRCRLNSGDWSPAVSGTASSPLPLAWGDNPLEIEVTAQDGVTTRTYSVNTTRVPAPDIQLEKALGNTALPAALTSSVLAWGYNVDGQINVPANLTDAVAIAAGNLNTAVLRANGTVVQWGGTSEYLPKVPFPAGLANVKQISVGSGHTMALKQDGTVVVWGDNDKGQANVPAGLTGVTAISAGSKHCFALKSDGTVVAWGYNGTGATALPADLGTVAAVSSGSSNCLALRANGTVAQWGWALPPQPADVTNIKAISAGFVHCLALREDGTLKVWGGDVWEPQPTGVLTIPAGATDISTISAGNAHNVVLRKDGTVFIWGSNSKGQGTLPGGLSNVIAACAGSWHSAAIVKELPVVKFGDLDAGGATSQTVRIRNTGAAPLHISSVALTGGDTADFVINTDGMSSDVPASNGETTFTVSFHPAGGMRAAFLRVTSDDPHKESYDLKLIGSGSSVSTNALLGSLTLSTGTLQPAFTPQVTSCTAQVSEITESVTFNASADDARSTLSWRIDSAAWQPGLTGAAQFPVPLHFGANTVDIRVTAQDGTTVKTYSVIITRPGGPEIVVEGPGGSLLRSSTPGTIVAWGRNVAGSNDIPADLTGVRTLSARSGHTMALMNDGTLRGWGDNSEGQLNIPAGLTGVTAVSAGLDHTLALKTDGTMVAWGNNSHAQCSIPTSDPAANTAIAAGHKFSLSLNHGKVVAWGDITSGITDVPFGWTDVTAIAAGTYHAAALRQSGAITVWGAGAPGFLDPPAGLTGVTAIAAGTQFMLALKSDGTVTGWGAPNGPATVPQGLTGITAIAAGGLHAMALKSDGTVIAWGSNDNGESTIPPGLEDVRGIVAGVSNSFALRHESSVADFGSRVPELESAAQTFTVRNTGTRDLTFSEFTISGAQASDFVLSGASSSTLAPGTAATFTITFQPRGPGLRQAILRVINNDTTEGTFTLPLNGIGAAPTEPQSAYLAWTASASLAGSSVLPASRLHGDGLPNLLKYAFNLDGTRTDGRTLTAGGSAGLPLFTHITAGSQPVFRVEFLRRRNNGLVYSPQRSDSLTSFVPFTATPVVTTVDANWERVVIEEPLSAAERAQQFGRVEVTLP
ncbi:MAG TPA: choice-of-anchor D domain-containing protein [Verrucomicrobiales bacterium]|nr:choice-of-anchor D domain-containing protein [Verrucomicrobiales bacterium]